MEPTASEAQHGDGHGPSVAEGLRTLVDLVSQPSGWRRVRLFGASASAPRVRRRADGIACACLIVVLAGLVPSARGTGSVEKALYQAIIDLPAFIDPFAAVAYDLLAVWAAITVVLVIVRGRWRLLLPVVATIAIALALVVAVNEVLQVDTVARGLSLGAPLTSIPIQFVLALALVSLVGREMSRPFRTFSRWLLAGSVVGAVLLPVASPTLLLCAVVVAMAATSAARFALGSPVTSASAQDVRDGLADLGVTVEPDPAWAQGTTEATAADGRRLRIRVLGRDDWNTQLMVTVWRVLWYRNSGGTIRVGPRQRIEHEAYLLLIAAARGAPVTPVVAAGTSRTGDALLATEVVGEPASTIEPARIDDELLATCWTALFALHAAGVCHGAIDPDALNISTDATVTLGGFEDAEAITGEGQVHADRAQLLVATALLVGPEHAVAAAADYLSANDPAGAAPLVAYLQMAALDPELRATVDHADLSLEDLRSSMASASGIDLPELQKVWRVTWGSILRLALLAFVGYVLISHLADIGWSTIADAITSANGAILAFALVFGQVPRVATAKSLQTASPAPVPLARLVRLEFAITFINLAVPSTAARVAANIRFFQRSGATAGAATSASALDSIFGFIAQLTLLAAYLLLGLGTLTLPPLSSSTAQRSDLAPLLLAVVAAIAIVVAVVLFVPKVHLATMRLLGQLRESLVILRSPSTVVRLLAYNLLGQLLFSATVWVVLQSFGQHVAFSDAVAINVAVALFSGLIPVPGGVGVTEGALTAGFVAVGVPQSTALAAALCYRLCTFYLPPLWGYLALRSLRRDGFL